MTRFADQPIPYPAAKDYGPRDRWPTLAVTWHMAEGTNVAQYLSRDPLRAAIRSGQPQPYGSVRPIGG